MIDGLPIGVSPHRILCRLPPVVHGTAEVSTLLKVDAKFHCHFTESTLIRSFETFPNTQVQTCSSSWWHLFIQNVLVECMNKTITCNECSIWPCSCSNCLKELASLGQVHTQRLNSFIVSPQSRCDSRGRKLYPRCACCH